jgi:hypothetical protein
MLVHISEATAGASVHYTTDGSTPTVNSRLYLTADPVQVLGTVTIKAIAVAPGHSQSAVASATYIIK